MIKTIKCPLFGGDCVPHKVNEQMTPPYGLQGNVLCLRELSQIQAVGERLPPIDVTSLTVRVAMAACGWSD